MTGPDFVKLAEAYRLNGLRCDKRAEVTSTVKATLADKRTTVVDFVVEQEDAVFPMVPAGADLDAMIRRPKREVLAESGADKEWQMPNGETAAVSELTLTGGPSPAATVPTAKRKPAPSLKKKSARVAPARAKAGKSKRR
jgi:acetolactate synthase-1/2/3 large subunit